MDTLHDVRAARPSALDDQAASGEPWAGPPVVRALAALIGLGAALSTGVLLLSDRAPGVLRMLFGDTARRIWARIDPEQRAAISDASFAQPDLAVHVAIWATVTALLALTAWRWRAVLIVIAGTAAASVVLEFGQMRWASTRVYETSDLVANLVGVLVGAAIAATVIGSWTAVRAALHRHPVRPVGSGRRR